MNFTTPLPATAVDNASGHVADHNALKANVTEIRTNLSNVDNTADSAKPVSTAQATALASKQTVVVYNTTTSSWPARPTSTVPVMAISTNSATAGKPTWMTSGQNSGDIWLPHPDQVIS